MQTINGFIKEANSLLLAKNCTTHFANKLVTLCTKYNTQENVRSEKILWVVLGHNVGFKPSIGFYIVK